jgi:hypothetical protein
MSNSTTSNSAIRYKAGRDRPTGYVVNDFEAFADTSLVTCWRTYKGKVANYNHDTDVTTVVNVSNAIVSSLHFLVKFDSFQHYFVPLALSPSLKHSLDCHQHPVGPC